MKTCKQRWMWDHVKSKALHLSWHHYLVHHIYFLHFFNFLIFLYIKPLSSCSMLLPSVVSFQFLTTEDHVQSHCILYGICHEQSGTQARFVLCTSVLPSISLYQCSVLVTTPGSVVCSRSTQPACHNLISRKFLFRELCKYAVSVCQLLVYRNVLS